MARIWYSAAAFFLFASGVATGAQAAGDIGSLGVVQATCNSLTISVQISQGWEVSPNPNVSTYRVLLGAGTQVPVPSIQTNSTPITLGGLQPSTQYLVIVSARSRHRGGWGIPLYRRVGGKVVSTPSCTVATAQPGDVRLRHEATGKCLFGHPADGAPVKTWGACWQDPAMAISLEAQGGAEVRIRIRATGRCLFGNPVNGAEVKSWTCWNDPNMVYVREDLGNNRLRLRHKMTGQCMYGSPVNGGTVRNWPCWADPNMVWVIDPF